MIMALRSLLGLEVPLRPFALRYIRHLREPDREKMETVLGVKPRPIDETLSETIVWFRSHAT
jgi:hypothetical protein